MKISGQDVADIADDVRAETFQILDNVWDISGDDAGRIASMVDKLVLVELEKLA